MNYFVKRYKIPFLISLMVGLAMIALKAEAYWLNAIFAFTGAIIAPFILDLDYLLYVTVVSPGDEHADEMKQNKGIGSYLEYIDTRDYEFTDLIFRSAVFVIALMVISLYVLTTSAFILVQALVITMLGCLIYYQIIEYQRLKSLKRWFWIYDGPLSRGFYVSYLALSLLVFVFLFRFI